MRRFLLYFLPLLLWMGLIFFASSQPYERQDLQPAMDEHLSLGWMEAMFSYVSFTYSNTEVSIDNLGVTGFFEFFIRKGAHVFAYFILAILAYRALYSINLPKPFLWSFLLVVFYAITDEIHQGFTPNRTPLVEDVVLDSIGGLLGLLLIRLIYQKYKRENFSADKTK
ncbi:VanZ family protein [Bacillus sp. FJAT-45350]|uniref:VanZ family protein n=1 Tax=Bacillus sp. FJAT-45350 TaxID=2011014 RepID=UPI000BB9A9DF|nr:VanZ family protein [Bacillus sp. FJAT-45350]